MRVVEHRRSNTKAIQQHTRQALNTYDSPRACERGGLHLAGLHAKQRQNTAGAGVLLCGCPGARAARRACACCAEEAGMVHAAPRRACMVHAAPRRACVVHAAPRRVHMGVHAAPRRACMPRRACSMLRRGGCTWVCMLRRGGRAWCNAPKRACMVQAAPRKACMGVHAAPRRVCMGEHAAPSRCACCVCDGRACCAEEGVHG